MKYSMPCKIGCIKYPDTYTSPFNKLEGTCVLKWPKDGKCCLLELQKCPKYGQTHIPELQKHPCMWVLVYEQQTDLWCKYSNKQCKNYGLKSEEFSVGGGTELNIFLDHF